MAGGFGRCLGRTMLCQLWRSIADFGLWDPCGLTAARIKGPQRPPKAADGSAAGGWRSTERRRTLRHPQEKGGAPALRRPRSQKSRGHGGLFHPRDVPLVEVPVMVTTKDGQFISNLKQENFRVYEDGVQQKISNFEIHKRRSQPCCWSSSPPRTTPS